MRKLNEQRRAEGRTWELVKEQRKKRERRRRIRNKMQGDYI